MIEPIILNQDFEQIALIDDYSSLIWTARFYKCGDFEICVPADEWHVETLQIGYYVTRNDDENVGIIEDLEMSIDEDMNETMIVTGRFLPCILERRIVATQTQLYGTVSDGVSALINDAIVYPVISARRIDNFVVVPTNFTARLEAQYTGKNLLETIEAICEEKELGFKVTLDDNNNFVFTLYDGVDRSYNQSENPYVVFSDEYDNLSTSEYQEQSSELVTNVLVAGEGEGLNRKTIWASVTNPTGLDRYEMYHDQRNMSTNDEEISDDEYYNQMLQEGLEQITTITKAFNGEVYFDNVEYKKDVCLGDVVTIENTRWGMSINSRLIEVIESVDEEGSYTITPTFGT